MTGFSNYSATNISAYITGQTPMPTLPAVYMALFTAVGTDAGTGFTEVSGGSYARVQVAGSVAATASFTTASPNITMTTNPGWVVPGMTVYDTTSAKPVGTVLTYSGTALVLTANASNNSSGTTDNLTFSAFSAATGTGPSTITNSAAVAFVLSTASWGTAIAFGFYDALTSGNLLDWDWLGNYAWLPCTISLASPGVFTAHAHGYSNGNSVVYSVEYGGTAPTGLAAGNTIQTVAGVTTDTFNVGVNTSTTGNGLVRQILQQVIPSNNIVSFAASQLVMTFA